MSKKGNQPPLSTQVVINDTLFDDYFDLKQNATSSEEKSRRNYGCS